MIAIIGEWSWLQLSTRGAWYEYRSYQEQGCKELQKESRSVGQHKHERLQSLRLLFGLRYF